MTGTTEPPVFEEKAIIGAGLMAGAANVIMQLSRPGVGYGVLESRVESGRIDRHPLKRTRTTFSYLAVATMGSDADKAAYRRAVDRAHAKVRSGASSPVVYNAFDPGLQLWVAACLYRGYEDIYDAFVGALAPDERERLYQSAATLGTTLQVPPQAWPANRAAFEAYWNTAMEQVSIDEPVRRYLRELAGLRFLPRPFSVLFGGFNRFVTTGFLPQPFRDQMHLPWSPSEQRNFDRFVAIVRTLVRLQPPPLRRFPFDLLLWDVRRRIRTGRPLA